MAPDIALRQTGVVLEKLFVAATQSEDLSGLVSEVREIATRRGDPELAALGERIVAAATEIANGNLGSNLRSGAVQDYFSAASSLLAASTA